MQRFAVYLRTTQCRGYPPLPHIMVDSEPPFGAGRFAMRASTLALALIRIHLFQKNRGVFFCIEKTALSDGFLFRLCFGFGLS